MHNLYTIASKNVWDELPSIQLLVSLSSTFFRRNCILTFSGLWETDAYDKYESNYFDNGQTTMQSNNNRNQGFWQTTLKPITTSTSQSYDYSQFEDYDSRVNINPTNDLQIWDVYTKMVNDLLTEKRQTSSAGK